MTIDAALNEGADPLVLDAIDWIIRLTVGTPADSDFKAFENWRSESEMHEQAFLAASELCRDLRAMQLSSEQQAALATQDNVLPFLPRAAPAITSRRAFLGGGAIAASLAGGLILSNPPLGLWPSFAELMADERTDTGERRQFRPLTGVAVELNSRSSTSRFDGNRGLKLIDGEVFVAVAAAQAFRVMTNGAEISATDADFNVRSFDGQQCITCTRGSLQISRQRRTQTLTAGQELLHTANGSTLLANADTATRLAWRRGLLILHRTSLIETISQINRYFPGKLVLMDASKRSWPVTGTFHIAQIDAAVVQISQLLNLGIRRLPGNVILIG